MFVDVLKETISENKGKCIAIMFILIIAILSLIICKINKNDDKIFKHGDYVFTYETNTILEKESSLPYINLNSDEIKNINNELFELYYETKALGKKYIKYNFYIYDNILSLVVELYNADNDDFIASDMYFYNIDIEEKRLINNEEIKDIFDVDDEYIETKVLEETKKYYDYEVKNKYINNCDFDCYKGNFGGKIVKDNSNYLVKEDGLYIYRYFSVDVKFAYDPDKPFDIYYFKIK